VDPASSRAQTRLGGALLLKQQNAAAIDAFRAAITLSANNADAFIGMAIAYLHSGDDALARAALEEAKRIDPTRAAKIDELIASIDQRAMSGGAH
jgi:Flp pilus assembly protein TadD